jgi:DNA end-binding protein Ku
VVLDEHDLTRAEPGTARRMEVLRFVPVVEVDPVYLDSSYYVIPEAAGQRPLPCCSKPCGTAATSP